MRETPAPRWLRRLRARRLTRIVVQPRNNVVEAIVRDAPRIKRLLSLP